ncbi:MAG: hypothetical protein ACLS3V_01230 [Streptococcus sp.]
MDSSYQELAAAMATSMGAWACGVDLIIPDKTQPASKENLIALVSSSTSIPLCICTPTVLKDLDRLSLQKS